MKNEPDHIIRSYFKKLNKNACIIEKDFNEEAIHLFRIDVKRLRAFLRMMRLGAEEPNELKFPREFKKMYSLTGKIRDRQLFLGRLQEKNKTSDNKLNNTISSLKQELEGLTSKKDQILTKNEFAVIGEKIKKNIPSKINEEVLENFFFQKLHVISEIIAKAVKKDKDLHNLRKNLKDILYIIGIFGGDVKLPLRFLCWDKAELKNAEELSHKLGLFNDTDTALSFLKPADIKKSDTGEKELLLFLRREFLAEKRKLKKELLNIIPKIKWILDY